MQRTDIVQAPGARIPCRCRRRPGIEPGCRATTCLAPTMLDDAGFTPCGPRVTPLVRHVVSGRQATHASKCQRHCQPNTGLAVTPRMPAKPPVTPAGDRQRPIPSSGAACRTRTCATRVQAGRSAS